MKRAISLSILLLGTLTVLSQNLQVTFTANADSIAVDSILATNLNTNESIVLPGNETLILEQSSGINELLNTSDKIGIYPNPFNGSANLIVNRKEAGSPVISVYNHVGQVLYQTIEYLEAGDHSFSLLLGKAGIYFITISGNEGESSIKAICTQTGNSHLGITYTGNSFNENLKSGNKAMSQSDEYRLAYSPDQVIHFKCYGDKYTTIFTDTVEASINYEVEFVDCTDPDGRTYKVVKIGEQFWMEENLAYLPQVNDSTFVSLEDPAFYVINYFGNDIQEAKAQDNYNKYGVLYNWNAANISCPKGWHLPSDAEWKKMELMLGMSSIELDNLTERYWRNTGDVGKKLKSTASWFENGNGNNISAFNALPAGGLDKKGGFWNQQDRAFFWSSFTNDNEQQAINRLFHSREDGVGRLGYDRSYGFSVRCIKDE